MAKEIVVKVKDCRTKELNEFVNFQGGLKELNAKDAGKLKQSIIRNGFTAPIFLWAGRNLILDGHQRVICLQQLKQEGYTISPVPFIEIEADTEKQAAELVLAYNSQYGRIISEELETFISKYNLDFKELPTFTQLDNGFNLDQFVKEKQLEQVQDTEADDPNEVITDIKKGDMFKLGRHSLICGDSTDKTTVEKLTQGKKIDLILTDPPYCSGGFQAAGKTAGSIGIEGNATILNDKLSNRGYGKLLKNVFTLVPTKLIYSFTDWRMWIELFDLVESSGYSIRSMIVWDKGKAGMGIGWRTQHELILFGAKDTPGFDPKLGIGNVIAAPRTGNKFHPTEKPIELLLKILQVSSNCDLVYDPFGGSGSTLIACEQIGRNCFVVELDEKYCQVIINRWEKLTGQKAVKVD